MLVNLVFKISPLEYQLDEEQVLAAIFNITANHKTLISKKLTNIEKTQKLHSYVNDMIYKFNEPRSSGDLN